MEEALKLIRELNPDATVITTPVEELGGKKVLIPWKASRSTCPMWKKNTRRTSAAATDIIMSTKSTATMHHHEHEEHGMSIITIMKSMLTTTTMT